MDTTIGAYVIEAEIGRGAMGRVLRARHAPTGAVRAMKVLDSNADPELVARFRREAEVLARIGGEHVVPVHEAGFAQGRLYYVMDLLPGSLETRLRARGALPWREAAALVAQVARSLARCHAAGVVHRDLKPANILLDDEGRPRLADFGLARVLDARSLTQTGTAMGTPGYMAPECYAGEAIGAPADVFALGVVLHELVTGEPPFEGTTAVALARAALAGERPSASDRVDCPAELDAIIARALAPEPRQRSSAEALAAALDGVLARGEPGRRGPLIAAGSAAALLVATALVALGRGAPPSTPPARSTIAAPTSSAAPTSLRPPVVSAIRLIEKGEPLRARQGLAKLDLAPAEKDAVVAAALAEAGELGAKGTRSSLLAAIDLCELAWRFQPTAPPPATVATRSKVIFENEWVFNGRPADDEECLRYQLVIVHTPALEGRADVARRLAHDATGLESRQSISVERALWYIDEAIASAPEHPSLRYLRYRALGIAGWELPDPWPIFRESWAERDWDGGTFVWFLLTVLLDRIDKGAFADAATVAEDAARWDRIQRECAEHGRDEIASRFTALRALAALKTGEAARARALVAAVASRTGSPDWAEVASAPDDAALARLLWERARAQGRVR